MIAAVKMPQYAEVVDATLARSRSVDDAVDALAVEFGGRILGLIPGRVSTEVDAHLSFDEEGTYRKAHELIDRYAAVGIGPERVLIKIASTWEGIAAAGRLEQEGIHCNLTLLFGLHQAIACADVGVTLISPFVGRILDWYKQRTGRDSYPATEDPGVLSVTGIYHYFKKYGYGTEVMGASFRNAGEIIELAGCDLLTISPGLLDELAGMTGVLERRLDPAHSSAVGGERLAMTHALFTTMHAADEMASEKLAEGISKFAQDGDALRALVAARLGS
jgi:transaldolase